MSSYKKILTLSFVALLTACAGNKAVVNPETGDKPAFNISGSPTFFKQADNQVALASFRVVFVTEGKRRQTAETRGRWGSKGDTSSSATVKTVLSGVDNDLMQTITDTAYADFVKAITEKGFQVVPMEQVVANPAFAKIKKRENGVENVAMKKVGKLFIDDKEDLSQYPTYSPTGLPLIDTTLFCKHIGSLGNPICLKDAVNKLGTVALHVNYVVDFSSFESSSKSGKDFAANSSYANAKVSTGQYLHLKPGKSGISVMGQGQSEFMFTLDGQNPYQTNQPFGESVEATSATDKAVSAFANVAGFFSESTKRSDSTVTYEMQAQPEVYKNIVSGMLAASSKELALNMEHYKK